MVYLFIYFLADLTYSQELYFADSNDVGLDKRNWKTKQNQDTQKKKQKKKKQLKKQKRNKAKEELKQKVSSFLFVLPMIYLWKVWLLFWILSCFKFFKAQCFWQIPNLRGNTHTHTHTHTYIYICVCVCVSVYIKNTILAIFFFFKMKIYSWSDYARSHKANSSIIWQQMWGSLWLR